VHELALMESVVSAVTDRVGAARVTTVRLEIGRLAAVVPEAMRFCFDVCAQGTSLEGASLEIATIPGRARCRACDRERSIDSYAELCACGAADLVVLQGEELRIKNVEVA
jgi:hydrogenase nickel incorporation protein HypA/HybF